MLLGLRLGGEEDEFFFLKKSPNPNKHVEDTKNRNILSVPSEVMWRESGVMDFSDRGV